ncbi:MAG: DeoR/GlpR family DNA-binding transcription regulator [Eubacteriaceae bacterium]
MGKNQRKKQILQLLEQRGTVEVSQLCTLFHVTPMTIRRDLDTLEAQGIIMRTHGGAILNNTDVLLEKPIHLRLNADVKIKESLGTLAAALLKDGEKIFISSGSTIYHFSKLIDNSKRLLVVTDGLNVATELNSRNKISIIVIGGELRENTLSTTGSFAEEMIQQFSFDTAYLGVTSIDHEGNLYHASTVEIGLYKHLSRLSQKVIVLAAASKLGKKDFVCVGKLKPNDLLITDFSADPNLINHYRDLGIEVKQA